MGRTFIGAIIAIILMLIAISVALNVGKIVDVSDVQRYVEQAVEEVVDTKIDKPSDPQQGDLLIYDGTSWIKYGAGTSGQVLQTQGPGANPVWATAFDGAPPTWANAPPRTATKVVAASDSSADSKAQA